MAPVSSTIAPGGVLSFSATLTNAPDQTVRWTATGGTITDAGVYTAPSASGTYTVTATSVAIPTLSASTGVTVTATSGVTVSVSPNRPTVGINAQQQFVATVSGSANSNVIWRSTAGTITSSGLFTAPGVVESVTITATSVADPTAFGNAVVSVVLTGPIVSLSPPGATLGIGESQQFTATVTNSSNSAVTWTATGGTISSLGFYQAGNSAGIYSVTATSVADPTRSATAQVTVKPITVTVTPVNSQILVGRQATFRAKVTGTLNTGVTWAASAGTIDSTGLFTAPATVATVTITATSMANPSVSGTATTSIVTATDLVYNFESGAPSVWNPTTVSTTPSGLNFLGQFGGTNSATLALTSLSPHQSVLVEFDIYVIGAWAGLPTNGQFNVVFSSSSATTTAFSQTFSNLTGVKQTYPNGGANAPGTGAKSTNTLGYVHSTSILFNDAVYHVSLTASDINKALSVTFSSILTGTLSDMSWGIDNVHIHANPQDLLVSDGEDGVGDGGGVGNAFAVAMMLAQHDAVDGRLDAGLLKAGLGFGAMRLRELEVGLSESDVFLAGVVIDQGVALDGLLILGLGDVIFASEAVKLLA